MEDNALICYDADVPLNNFCLLFRLLGSATVPLKDLVKDSSHTMQADVNLLDGSNRMTQVSVGVKINL